MSWKRSFGDGIRCSEFKLKLPDPRVPGALQYSNLGCTAAVSLRQGVDKAVPLGKHVFQPQAGLDGVLDLVQHKTEFPPFTALSASR